MKPKQITSLAPCDVINDQCALELIRGVAWRTLDVSFSEENMAKQQVIQHSPVADFHQKRAPHKGQKVKSSTNMH